MTDFRGEFAQLAVRFYEPIPVLEHKETHKVFIPGLTFVISERGRVQRLRKISHVNSRRGHRSIEKLWIPTHKFSPLGSRRASKEKRCPGVDACLL